jgi:galactokinase
MSVADRPGNGAAVPDGRQARGGDPVREGPPGFRAVFGRIPQAGGDAPGRVNLLGEHTDYNDGYVLPIAIPQRARVDVARGPGPGFRLHAAEYGTTVAFGLSAPPPEPHATHVYGCLRELADGGATLPALDLHLRSSVPIGVGLSSSAALEVATLRALDALLGLALDPVALARLAQRAETRWAGVPGSIMDRMAASLADTGHMLFLDTRDLERLVLPLPVGGAVLVLDSGVPRALAARARNRRRDECRQAAQRLGVASLRDIDDPAAADALPAPLRGRARHVVTENARVVEAVSGADAGRFGALMNASHASLRDDFEVSTPALDALVGLLQSHPDVHGARLTGAGFGGACVALVRPGSEAAVARSTLAGYAALGLTGQLLVPPAAS